MRILRGVSCQLDDSTRPGGGGIPRLGYRPVTTGTAPLQSRRRFIFDCNPQRKRNRRGAVFQACLRHADLSFLAYPPVNWRAIFGKSLRDLRLSLSAIARGASASTALVLKILRGMGQWNPT